MSFLSSDTQVPTAPDYSPFVSAYNNIAQYAQQHGNDALDWAKGQIASNSNLTNDVTKGLVDTATPFAQAAKSGLAQSQGVISQGIQNLRDQYDKYTNPARKAADMGAAGAQAAQGDEAARQANMSELESYGLNPGAVRYAGLDAGARLQSAATRVGAENIAGRTDDALADQTNQELLGQGNTLAGQATANAGTSGTLGTGAVNTSLANTASGYQGIGTGLQWTQPQTSALGGAVGATNTGFTNTAEADKINNSSSSGLGTLAGLGMSALGKGGALASGGALSGAIPALAAFLADGGVVPAEASPSGGAVTDDVPAGANGVLRVNAGEFVIPKDVVSWEGEKTLQSLIEKARKAKMEAGAKPQVKPVTGPQPSSPAFQNRPQAPQGGALPV
jgi:hypothetical protein